MFETEETKTASIFRSSFGSDGGYYTGVHNQRLKAVI